VNEFKDDELTDVIQASTKSEASSPTARPATAAAPATPNSTPTATALDEPEDVPVATTTTGQKNKAVQEYDWNSEKLETEGDGITRIKPSKDSDRPVRFSILPGPLFGHRQHWVTIGDKKSCRLCLSEDGSPRECCEFAGEDGRMRIIAPALQYLNTNSKGLYDKGVPTEVRVGYVDLSPAHFKILRNLGTEESRVDILNADLLMSYEKKRYEFKLIASEARWKKLPAIKAQVESELARMMTGGGRLLQKRLGKPTTLAEWKRLTATPAKEANLSDLDELPY
jgi:hypothetical protein